MKTKSKHFEIYKKEIFRLQKEYGLMGWEGHVIHREIPNDTVSQIHINRTARNFVVELNIDYDDVEPVTVTGLKNSAKHEMLELLFSNLEDMVCESKKEQAREEVHAIIQTLINIK